jgi:macrolide transport system ATP-binding/permease protein
MLNDIRYALRMLRQNPGFAATAIVSIALAIGSNTAIFSLADVLVFRPLPVRNASNVVSVRAMAPSSAMSALADGGMDISYPDFADIRDKSHSFDGLIAYRMTPAGFAKDDRSQAQLRMGYLVSGNLFQVLGVEPSLGRGFRPEEDQVLGRDPVIVLAHDFWTEEFSRDASIIGRQVRLNGIDFTVVGVAPESFFGITQFVRPAFFVPVMMASRLNTEEDLLGNRRLRNFGVKGRLKPGVTIQAANEEVSTIAKTLEASYPDTNKGFGAAVRTEIQLRLDRAPMYGPIIVSLFTLVAIVLLIACCNVANLILSRGQARYREIAVRLAIGASRFRLIRQLMAECLLIALAGGALGLLVAQAGTDYFSRIETVSDSPVKLDYQIDGRVLAFTFLVSVASAVFFGLIPVLRSTRPDLTPALKTGTQSHHRKRFLGRRALVVAQIAGSLVLLIAAGGVYHSAVPLAESRGFRTDHLLTVRFDTAVAGYSPERSKEFQKRLIERSRGLPGVKTMTFAYGLPLTAIVQQHTVVPENYSFPAGQSSVSVLANTVDEGYFEALGVPVVRGRSFHSTDASDSPRVAIVNSTFAQKYLGSDAIGKRIRLQDKKGEWAEMIGVVATGKYLSPVEPPTPFVYLPLAQNPESRLTLLAQSYGDPTTLAGPMRELLRSIDSNVPVLSLRTMDDIFQRTIVQAIDMVVMILGSASLIGLALALAGLYGIVAYQVTRRTREIGIRIALGANRPQVMRMILKQAAGMGVAGVVIGLAMNQALSGLLNAGSDPEPSNPWLLTLVPLMLLLTTLLAAAIPAQNAMRIDPQAALRDE